MKKTTRVGAVAAAVALAVTTFTVPAHAAVTELTVWAMQGQDGEVKAAKEEVGAFNASQDNIHVTLQFKASMGDTLKNTNVNGLADVFEFDGETLGALVYDGKLAPLKGLVSASTISRQLTSIKAEGTASDGKTYSVSQFDSGLSLWGNKSMLKAAGVTNYPTTFNKAWTASQFTGVLKTLAAKAKGHKAIDMKENYGIGGGWAGYAFTPIINSAGNELVKNGKAVGSMNSAKAVAAMKVFASWKKYSDPSTDDSAFTKKRVALAWVGHWATPGIKAALGKDAVLIPLPNFGNGSKSGQGSHSWAIGANSDKKAAAATFLNYIMTDKWILNLTEQNGAVPGTKTALAKNKDYAKGGLLELYGQQLAASCGSGAPTAKCVTVPRTISAAWPVINTQFSQAAQTIWDGGNAAAALTKAAKAIDQDYNDNNGYKD
jgi:multiple sugar transport system substrate-binding protein